MPQTSNSRGYDYEMPPPLVHALVAGTTWCLRCRDCRREIAVDVIRLVESVDDVRAFDSAATFRRARCRECGGRLKLTGGFQVGALKNTGWMPRLIAGDGRPFRRPAAQIESFTGGH